MAASVLPGGTGGWRIFVSHTSELREFPVGGSYVVAVERAVSACGHVIVDMADFPAADQSPAALCRERVFGCQVYVGVIGTRYGTPVRDRPEVSYTELEFDTAGEAGLPRLMFLLDTEAAGVGIPLSRLIDVEFGARQEAFRQRVRSSDLVTQVFADPATLGHLVERSLRDLVGRLGGGADPGWSVAVRPAVLVVGDVPQEPVGFQPRDDLLDALNAPGPRLRVVHALTGMLGVGKTHLAAAYARARLAQGWRLVAWVNAEDPAMLLAGLAEVAAGLGLGQDAGDGRAAGRAVRHWLEVGGERCLLVFDNATDPELLRPFLPAAGAARVIITSNQRSVTYLGSAVPVDVFSEAEALTFLADRTGQADTVGARALTSELGCLPLALAQAAAVIASQHLSYGTYLDRVRRLQVGDLLAPDQTGEYPRGVAAAVLLSVDAVRAADETGVCGAVMDLLSVLSAAGVRRSLIHPVGARGFQGRDGPLPEVSPEVADEALARLAGASLVTFSVDGTAVTVHRLVMRVIRENLAAAGRLAAVCSAVSDFLEDLAARLRESWHQDMAAARELVEQIVALSASFGNCAGDIDLAGRSLRLRWWVVWFLNSLGDSAAETIRIAEPLLADQERVLGTDHPETLTTRNNLAYAYRDAGRTAESISLHERTLADQERVLGTDHPDTLRTRNNLGLAYQEAGRIAEAISLHERTLADRERVLGIDHPATLRTRGNLASAYRQAGRIAESISLHERTLADWERLLGIDHPDTLRARGNLASAFQAAGRITESISLHERTRADRERVLGTDHPDTLRTQSSLASAYCDAGRTAESISLHERTLAGLERVLGVNHPDTVTTRNNLNVALGGKERPDTDLSAV